MKIGNTLFEIGKRTYIMGILNITPDSFSDGGRYTKVEAALCQAERMISEGADMIDIGGESTRPGHMQITEHEESQRVVPVIQALKREFPHIPISIDTYKSYVCQRALDAGADLINDIWGFKYDRKMARLAAQFDVPCCLMHNRNTTAYSNLLSDISADLQECLNIALSSGVKRENIILDPGIGFGKTYEQNLIVMNNLDKIKETFHLPLLLGTSRKSMIGKALGNVPTEERLEGTVATTVMGVMQKCDFIRVHDVLENKQACLMTDAVVRA